MEFGMSIFRDMVNVLPDDAIIRIDNDRNIVATHKSRGHNIVTWFKGDGVMWIYRDINFTDIQDLKKFDHMLYDVHWSVGTSCYSGYRKAIAKLIIGE